VRVGPPAEEPPPAARLGCDAGGAKAPARDDVSPPVHGGTEPELEVLTGGLNLSPQSRQGLGLRRRLAEAEEVDGLPPGVRRVLDRLELGPPARRTSAAKFSADFLPHRRVTFGAGRRVI
jgi:hypothetical protein